MPQEFQVVRCFKCLMFQVEIVKKIPKWRCCICHEKQSVKKIFEKGLSKDCRLFVQENNKRLITITEKSSETPINPSDNTDAPSESVTSCSDIQESKWIDFDDSKTSHTSDQESAESYTFKSPPKKKFKKMKENNFKNAEVLENDSGKEFDEDDALENPKSIKNTTKWLFYCNDNKVTTNSSSLTKYENRSAISNTKSIGESRKKETRQATDDLLIRCMKPELQKFEDNELNLDSVLSYD